MMAMTTARAFSTTDNYYSISRILLLLLLLVVAPRCLLYMYFTGERWMVDVKRERERERERWCVKHEA